MSDRVVILSAGPASHPIGEFTIDIQRPRDVAEVKMTPRFIELHSAIWAVLREEVLKGYQQQLIAGLKRPPTQRSRISISFGIRIEWRRRSNHARS